MNDIPALIAEARRVEANIDLAGSFQAAAMIRRLADALAALTTPQAVTVVPDDVRSAVQKWLQREFGSVLAHDPHNPERFWGGSTASLLAAFPQLGRDVADIWDEGYERAIDFERGWQYAVKHGETVPSRPKNPYREESGR